MEKQYKEKDYKRIITIYKEFFMDYYYHSIIDLNLTKLDSILEYGILSKRLIEMKKIINLYTHNAESYDSKNGNDYISLSEFSDNTAFSKMFESFTLHTLSCVSLMIDKDINVEEKGKIETFFDDEIFVKDYISTNHIKGIILPSHLSNMSISEVNCLPNDIECYTKKYITNWIKVMEIYFKKEIEKDKIWKSLNEFWDILEEYEQPEKWLQSAVKQQRKIHGEDIKDILAEELNKLWCEKLQRTNPSYLDVIMAINKDRFPVYEIKQKSIKMIKK